jgi:hypothetical protein
MEVASNYGRGSCQQHRRKLRHSTEDPLLAQAAAYSSTAATTATTAAAGAGTAAAAAIDVDSDDEDAAVNEADDDDSDGEGDAPDSSDVALDRDEELLITSTFLYLMSKVRESSSIIAHSVLVVFNWCAAYSAIDVAIAAL